MKFDYNQNNLARYLPIMPHIHYNIPDESLYMELTKNNLKEKESKDMANKQITVSTKLSVIINLKANGENRIQDITIPIDLSIVKNENRTLEPIIIDHNGNKIDIYTDKEINCATYPDGKYEISCGNYFVCDVTISDNCGQYAIKLNYSRKFTATITHATGKEIYDLRSEETSKITPIGIYCDNPLLPVIVVDFHHTKKDPYIVIKPIVYLKDHSIVGTIDLDLIYDIRLPATDNDIKSALNVLNMSPYEYIITDNDNRIYRFSQLTIRELIGGPEKSVFQILYNDKGLFITPYSVCNRNGKYFADVYMMRYNNIIYQTVKEIIPIHFKWNI